MARILGGGMPQPYGAFDPMSGGPRMDLWFRKILESMQGIKDTRAAKTEAERKAGMEERKLRVGERGVELREAEFEKEGQPMVLPPEMVSKASAHFNVTPESFQSLDKSVQVSMIGEMIRETGREKERTWREGQEADKLSRLKAEEAVNKTEKERIRELGKHYGLLKTARARLEEERTRIVNMHKTQYASEGRSQARQVELDKLDKYFNMLGTMDGKLDLEQPLDALEIKTLEQILEDISVIREGTLLGGGLKKEARGEPEDGEKKVATSGKYKGMIVEYNAEDNLWYPAKEK